MGSDQNNMAQGKVTEFFNARKRNAPIQPSKRRKVQVLESNDSEQITVPSEVKSVRITRQRSSPVVSEIAKSASKQIQDVSKTTTRVSARRKTTKSKSKPTTKGNIETFFNPKGTDICDEPTAALDDHNASPATPSKTCSKRSIRAVAPEDHLQKLGCTPESAKGYNFEKAMKTKHSPEVSARRKLHMP